MYYWQNSSIKLTQRPLSLHLAGRERRCWEETADNIRRVDVRVGNTFFEFKSVDNVPPNGFAVQFIKDMDLPEVSDLNQIKWWFDGKKVSTLNKQEFLNQLTNVEATLSVQIKSNLILKFAPGGDFADVIDAVDNSFTTIFKISADVGTSLQSFKAPS